MDMDMTGGGMERQDDDDDVRVGGEEADDYEMIWSDVRTGMAGGGGGTIPNKGTDTITTTNTTSKRNDGGAGMTIVGASERRMGRGGVSDATILMMQRKVPKMISKKPFKKHSKGAKSSTRKGKIIKTDPGQQGIRRFLCSRKTLIGEFCVDIGSGRQNSLGSSRNSYINP